MAGDAGTRLDALRALLADAKLDGFVLPRGDEHLGEYVAPYAERLAWLTGFTGSAGAAVILSDRAAVFSDGRYTLQLAAQTDGACWERLHSIEQPPGDWLAERAGAAGRTLRIGFDPWLLSEDGLDLYRRDGVELVAVNRNPIDAVWGVDRPAPPDTPIEPHPIALSGLGSAEKREAIAAVLRDAGEEAVILTDPASIAWLLNIRARDVAFTPFALGFAVLDDAGNAELFAAPVRTPPETREWLGNRVAVRSPVELERAVRGLAGKRVRLDRANAASWFARILREGGASVSFGADPVALPKARKNRVEQLGAMDAHRHDGIALTRFLFWLSRNGVGTSETELSRRLDRFRQASPMYRGESFPAISGSGPNGAIIHYRAEEGSARILQTNEIYLIDSGGQYDCGTTDVTRTVWSGPDAAPDEIRERATRVLAGHLALAAARFPPGITGNRLDTLARAPLWAAGLDYDHGTGHGVGSFLSVHEGPCSIAPKAKPVALEPGMILSNEPGFYAPGEYGMRFENLLLVRDGEADRSRRKILHFETLTLAPFDRALIVPELLTEQMRRDLDAYHARVLASVGPGMDADGREWLERVCAPV